MLQEMEAAIPRSSVGNSYRSKATAQTGEQFDMDMKKRVRTVASPDSHSEWIWEGVLVGTEHIPDVTGI